LVTEAVLNGFHQMEYDGYFLDDLMGTLMASSMGEIK